MDLPERRKYQARKNARGAEDDGPAYLRHADGTWSLVGPDGWPVSPEDSYAELDAGTYAPVNAELLTDVLRGLAMIDVEPISVRDREIR
ncbi:hypothetical protein NONO_c52360 [Nocardia nova SH22a]|uniref:Uncharacterized protein n=1 Tax=Nocardia nova SH22a TaxID=1415166 RepID=W5TS20_9NOCA|nr:hypothetical protein [Nocardia nova]AHH20016.1 hypothetical protein NONO_c52360 [Nocardia nova SH22a]